MLDGAGRDQVPEPEEPIGVVESSEIDEEKEGLIDELKIVYGEDPGKKYNNLLRSFKLKKTSLLVMLESEGMYDDTNLAHRSTKKLSSEIKSLQEEYGIDEGLYSAYEKFEGIGMERVWELELGEIRKVIDFYKKAELIYQELLERKFSPEVIRQ